jgi:glycosyltransferase involved in cell wall biosynthesis
VAKMKGKMRVTFVLPVQSPYYSKRLSCLALHSDLDLTLLLEQRFFSHRPGWMVEPIDGVRVEVLGGAVFATTSKGDDEESAIHGVRSIPWRLPIVLWHSRPMIVVLCNATQLLLALPIKWLLGVRLVQIVEDTPHAKRNTGGIRRRIRGWLMRRADSWVAFSEDAKEYLKQIGITHGVKRSSWSLDMNEFKRQTTLKSLGSQGESSLVHRTVAFVGSLVRSKGIIILLESWQSLPKSVRLQSRLLILGTGPLMEEVLKFISFHSLDEVLVIGQVSYDNVKNYLSSSDLLVLPTMQDLFSLTVLEAMACGCAVITTPFNGARELIDEGVNGWIVDPTQPGALSAALERALTIEHDNLKRMGSAARLRVESMDNVLVMSTFAQDLYNLVSAK